MPTPTPWTFSEQDTDTRRHLAFYYAMIEILDWNIGRLTDALGQLPSFVGESTLLVYTSDHGDFMGSHGLFDRKEHPHEESTRIPAVFHWPGKLPPQGVVDGLFDLEQDPYEMSNLAGSHPEVCDQMRLRLLDLLREMREPYFDVLLQNGVPFAADGVNVADEEYRILGLNT